MLSLLSIAVLYQVPGRRLLLTRRYSPMTLWDELDGRT
jgi:hypothetical protein